MIRRERLLRFIDYVGADRRQYVVTIGDCRVKRDALTDDMLEQLAERVRLDFWFERKINRQNRAIYASRRPAPALTLVAAE